ncbi:hypothetical protein KRX51_08680 [Corynebacterium sp. TAE3-ERU12]|uniref:hypothetical protein n=1 Tax=Corynebacterium sp. TAE3-ERU12 TaxID=2849491 RepID=UPI001C45592A|nr:hypothetical protein [Corynebacterium sp. TAE3-ERU12]MBV7295983.1 hypothetical protein [Corynebacterium sp. TAE3-ERU12]
MAHFNLYEVLNLDRNKSSDELRQTLDEWIHNAGDPNSEQARNLTAARNVLGDSDRRSKYDAVLDDPNASDLTEKDVFDLANLNSSADNSNNAAEQGKEKFEQGKEKATAMAASAKEFASEQAKQTQEVFKKTDRKPIIITAVVSVLATLLVVGLFSLLSNLGDTEEKAVDLAEEFTELRDTDDTQEWVQDNVPASIREDIQNDLSLNNRFAGVDAYFGVDDPEVGLVMPMRVDGHEAGTFPGLLTYFNETGIDEDDDIYIINIDGDDDEPAGGVTIAVGDDGARLIAVTN